MLARILLLTLAYAGLRLLTGLTLAAYACLRLIALDCALNAYSLTLAYACLALSTLLLTLVHWLYACGLRLITLAYARLRLLTLLRLLMLTLATTFLVLAHKVQLAVAYAWLRLIAV
jgi:hypothetical protein